MPLSKEEGMNQQLERATRLKKRLEEELGTTRDVLSSYREWLDKNGIEAEGKDGFPSDDAYESWNIESFLQSNLIKL